MTAQPASIPLRLEARGLMKTFSGVTALRSASFELRAGEIHALVGENGAGKSTLVKILSGALPRDAGDLFLDGRPADPGSPAGALALGIALIPQDLQLVPGLTVAENVFLGRETLRGRTPFLDRVAMERAARRILAELGDTGDVREPAGRLPIARRQLVEIGRALGRRARVLLLDEPTASLSPRESAALLALLRRLRERGTGILYITHRLDEVFEIADRVTVLRNGEVAATARTAETGRAALIRWMVGREPGGDAPPPSPAGEEILRVENLSGGIVRGASLSLRRGEILGLAGLVGAGRSELARLLFGADPPRAGRILLRGRPIAPRSPREAIACGLGLLTEDRNRFGLVPEMNVRENVTLASLGKHSLGPFVRAAAERQAASGAIGRLRIKAPSTETPVAALSGGNRQKVVLARWLEAGSTLLLFDEPTAGMDVGAREEIHALIRERAASGVGILVISSDFDEVLALCDRIAVMSEGRITGEVSRGEATRARLLALATPERVSA